MVIAKFYIDDSKLNGPISEARILAAIYQLTSDNSFLEVDIDSLIESIRKPFRGLDYVYSNYRFEHYLRNDHHTIDFYMYSEIHPNTNGIYLVSCELGEIPYGYLDCIEDTIIRKE